MLHDFSEVTGDIDKCRVFLVFVFSRNEIRQHLERLGNSVNQNSPNDQCTALQNPTGVKGPFPVQDTPVGSDVAGNGHC